MTASARHRWTLAKRSGTKPKFFNDFSRACMRVRVRQGPFGLNEQARTEAQLHRRRTEQSNGPEKLYCKRSHGQALIISEG